MTDKIAQPLLEVSNLKTYFFTEDGVVKAVDGVDFYVAPGEILGLVGESGCGKSVTSLSIMRLIGIPGKIMDGHIEFEGRSLLELSEAEMVEMRGNRMSMIFQQPQSSLNPVFKVGDQVAEVLQIHRDMGREEAWERAVDLLRLVGIPDAESKAHSFPHEMSGGQAQRVMIAMALALNPQLLIADEPTTALDVTIQAQILDLMRDLSNRMGTSVILITHDLGVVAEMADRVAVMYAGRIVEETDVAAVFSDPLHPYTQGLIDSIPILGTVKDRLDVIPGGVPNLINLPPGCQFAPRCRPRIEHKLTLCTDIEPDLIVAKPQHKVRCWLYQDTNGHKAPLKYGRRGPASQSQVISVPQADDLKEIEGIGPKIEDILKEKGISTFAALAGQSVDRLRSILEEAGISRISDPSTWSEQAKLAADGKWESLKALQDELKGGRRN